MNANAWRMAALFLNLVSTGLVVFFAAALTWNVGLTAESAAVLAAYGMALLLLWTVGWRLARARLAPESALALCSCFFLSLQVSWLSPVLGAVAMLLPLVSCLALGLKRTNANECERMG